MELPSFDFDVGTVGSDGYEAGTTGGGIFVGASGVCGGMFVGASGGRMYVGALGIVDGAIGGIGVGGSGAISMQYVKLS